MYILLSIWQFYASDDRAAGEGSREDEELIWGGQVKVLGVKENIGSSVEDQEGIWRNCAEYGSEKVPR